MISQFVIAGHSRPKDGVASLRLCPAISLREALWSPERDARHKAGHDDVERLVLEKVDR